MQAFPSLKISIRYYTTDVRRHSVFSVHVIIKWHKVSTDEILSTSNLRFR